MQFVDYKNVHQMIKSVVDKYPDKFAFRWFTDDQGNRDGVNWNQFYVQAKQVAKSLMALDVKKEDKINIISNTCYRWSLTDIGTIISGAVTVGIYQSNLPKDCQYIIDHSDAVVVFVEDEVQLNKLFTIRDKIPKVRKVVMINGTHKDDWVISYEEFLSLGDKISDKDFEKRANEPKPNDPATLVYTSGTTGVPKGVVITQDNLTFNSQSIKASLQMLEGDDTIVFLPLAHVMARLTVYSAAISGTVVTIARSLDTAVEDIGFTKPHWIPSVPRVYEKIYSKVVSGAEEKGGIILKLFNWACNVGYQVSDCKTNKKPIPGFIGFQYAIASKLVFSKLQKVLGGNIRWMLSGGAPLNESIAKFFHAAGILVLEGIGMTENASFSHSNRFDDYKFGTVGLPGPGIETKIAKDGEILIRGRNVMREYYKMADETKKTFTKDGWLLTGDLGVIDSKGFLTVTGRKKEIIITAGGKNVAPALLEGVIGTSTYINQAMVVGDRRKYLTALVTIDPLTVEEYAKKNGISYSSIADLGQHPEIRKLIENEVQEKNKEFASFETIKKVAIVPEFTVENGLITPTLKLKKNLIEKQYKNDIDNLYVEN
ncbi:long-chain fatty acid--CoA ligase [bacterium]|nr:long-chain fatty acid--CoA ligase [bacterium]